MTTAIMESTRQCAQTKTARIEKGTSKVVHMTKTQSNKVLVALCLCPERSGKLRELNDNDRKCAACGHVLYVYPVTDAVLCVTCRNAANIDRRKVSLDVLNGKRERTELRMNRVVGATVQYAELKPLSGLSTLPFNCTLYF